MHHETRKVAELNTLKLFNSMLILQEMLALYFLARSLFARDFTMADAGSLPVGLKNEIHQNLRNPVSINQNWYDCTGWVTGANLYISMCLG